MSPSLDNRYQLNRNIEEDKLEEDILSRNNVK